MDRLAHVTSAADVTLVAATTSAFPPTSFGVVPSAWGNVGIGHVPELDIDLVAAGAASITDLKVYGATRFLGSIAGATFTTTHATETVNITTHGLLTGDGPVQLTTSGALPAGFALLTDYWIIRTGASTLKLALSLADALAGTAVEITGDGTGTHTLTGTAVICQLVRWRLHGIAESSVVLASIREGYCVRCQHDPRVIAYAVVWTGTAANAITATMTPIGDR